MLEDGPLWILPTKLKTGKGVNKIYSIFSTLYSLYLPHLLLLAFIRGNPYSHGSGN